MLEKGFIARKLNYSNKKTKDVLVKLSKNHKYLQYETISDDVPTFIHLLTPSKNFYLSNCKGFIYGGHSLSFKYHKAKNQTQLDVIK